MSVSSGLSVAVPKYFLPATLATLKRPVFEASVDSEDGGFDDARATSMDPCSTVLAGADVEES